jgi:hypothetical protein
MKRTVLTPDQKEANKKARQEERQRVKEFKRIEAEKNQKHVKSINFSIEWKKSRMWGANPHLTTNVIFKDGTREQSQHTAGGCGYDKESTVIADAFNLFLKYKLHEENENLSTPYGIYIKSDWKHFSGGIGTNCYYKIAEAINGKFEHIASGKTFDVFKYTDNEE